MNRGLRRSRLLGLCVVIAVLAADQLTKAWVVASLPQRARIAVVPGLFDITHVTNPGGVWSVGAGLGGAFRKAVFLALPIVITAFAAWYSWSLPARARLRQAAIALVVGGALGNLADRLFRHPPEVVDFLLAHWRNHFWPAFNVADSAICVGVGILLVASFLEDEPEHDKEESDPAVPAPS